MIVAHGTTRLLYEDARWTFGRLLLLYITLPVTLAWIIIGSIFDLDNAIGAISVPTYAFIIGYGVNGFKKILPIGIGLGSTRTQLLKSFYLVSTLSVVFIILILNLLQFLLATLYEQGISSANILHPGRLFISEYQFISYLWIDLMLALFLFGSSFLLYCIMYRFGTKRTLIGSVIIGIAALFLYYSGALSSIPTWFQSLEIHIMYTFTIIGIIGSAILLITYLMMRNVSLVPKGKNE